MAKKMNVSLKHVQIDKANTVVVAVVAIAAFVLVFTGFAVNALLTQRSYQAKVIEEKETTRDILLENKNAAEELQLAYQQFDQAPVNVIGGMVDGDGQNDGSNTRIVLDALPSSYDFPALMTSIELILSSAGVNISAITGTDEELISRELDSAEEVQMPFGFDVSTSYEGVKLLVSDFERSIRPFSLNTIEMSGDDADATLRVTGHTYFKPGIIFELGEKVVQPE